MTISSENRALIDESLREFAAQELIRARSIGIQAQEPTTLEIQQQSRLGMLLEHLAEIAEQGLTSMGRTQAKIILKDVYDFLFKGAFQTYPLIPASFDTTPLGKLITQAKVRILDLQDVVNVTEASKISGIARAQLYLMIETGYIHPINMNNRAMIEREELERVASERQQQAKGGHKQQE